MGNKILIIGGVAGGASAAARLRRHSEEDQIIMFEKGPHVSFSNCALPYHLSGMIESAEQLVLMNPTKFMKQYHIDARVNQEVIAIDRQAKKVIVKHTLTDEQYEENYDKLILSPGAKPIIPHFEGMSELPTFAIRNVVDISRLNEFLKEKSIKKVAVIGGGYIGVEVAENLKEGGYKVALIEAVNQILRPFDEDLVQIFHKELYDHGVELILGDKVEYFEANKVVLVSGKKVEAEAVVMAIGVTPDTQLAVSAGIELGETGAIKVDMNYMTNDPDIYAVGDAIEVPHALSGAQTKLSLAGPAQKQARAVADYIHGEETVNKGYIGSSAIKVFEYNGAATGLNENLMNMLGLDIHYQIVNIIQNDKVGLMPDSQPMHFKLLFEVPSGKVLGAQAIGKGNVDKRIDVVATAIKFGATVEELRDLELCYAPPFGTAKDVVNYAGYIASNLLKGDFKQINVNQVRPLLESGATFIDVREKVEYDRGHLKGVKNMPLSELRQRVEELPKDEPVYIHCRSGQRSYNAVLALQNLGFDNVINVTGSFLGICLYEYYWDQVLERESIVTKYNFK
ncbi:MAG: FAD-dependent oxidoreductase [Cellulosilyticaceae bacterium]